MIPLKYAMIPGFGKTGFGPEAPHILGHLSCITWTAMGKPLGFLRSAVP